MKAVTGKPIKFAGTGEKLEDFEPFHPERMASRILGMGDVVSLVERAAEAVDQDEAEAHGRKDAQGPVHAGGFSRAIAPDEKARLARKHRGHAARRRGDDEGRGLGEAGKGIQAHGGDDLRDDAKERRKPQILNAKRRIRIAKGSGVTRDRAEHDAEQIRPDAADDEEDGQVPEDDGEDGRRPAGDVAEITFGSLWTMLALIMTC